MGRTEVTPSVATARGPSLGPRANTPGISLGRSSFNPSFVRTSPSFIERTFSLKSANLSRSLGAPKFSEKFLQARSPSASWRISPVKESPFKNYVSLRVGMNSAINTVGGREGSKSEAKNSVTTIPFPPESAAKPQVKSREGLVPFKRAEIAPINPDKTINPKFLRDLTVMVRGEVVPPVRLPEPQPVKVKSKVLRPQYVKPKIETLRPISELTLFPAKPKMEVARPTQTLELIPLRPKIEVVSPQAPEIVISPSPVRVLTKEETLKVREVSKILDSGEIFKVIIPQKTKLDQVLGLPTREAVSAPAKAKSLERRDMVLERTRKIVEEPAALTKPDLIVQPKPVETVKAAQVIVEKVISQPNIQRVVSSDRVVISTSPETRPGIMTQNLVPTEQPVTVKKIEPIRLKSPQSQIVIRTEVETMTQPEAKAETLTEPAQVLERKVSSSVDQKTLVEEVVRTQKALKSVGDLDSQIAQVAKAQGVEVKAEEQENLAKRVRAILTVLLVERVLERRQKLTPELVIDYEMFQKRLEASSAAVDEEASEARLEERKLDAQRLGGKVHKRIAHLISRILDKGLDGGNTNAVEMIAFKKDEYENGLVAYQAVKEALEANKPVKEDLVGEKASADLIEKIIDQKEVPPSILSQAVKVALEGDFDKQVKDLSSFYSIASNLRVGQVMAQSENRVVSIGAINTQVLQAAA
jgi:hypothetical protein